MQDFSERLKKLPNKTNWRVVHDEETNMYYLKNDNGNRLNQFFTQRRFAEAGLVDYLNRLNRQPPSRRKANQKEEVTESAES